MSYFCPVQCNTGNYYIGAYVDNKSSVSEVIESNNGLAASNMTTITRSSTSKPNLKDVKISSSTTNVKIGEKMSVSTSVVNRGTANANSFQVGIYLSNDNVITQNDTYLGECSITTLLTNKGGDCLHSNITIPLNIKSGTYYLGAYADYKSLISEQSESDNTASIKISVNGSQVDFNKGEFVTSWETTTTGYHGLKYREYITAPSSIATSYGEGWTYNVVNGKKHGLQVYKSRSLIYIEYFENGKIVSTASYSNGNGKPDGWFYHFDSNGKKHGTQYYLGSTGNQVVEEYLNGEIIRSGSYWSGKPNGWFYVYKNSKKEGVQTYVSGDRWSIETYSNGVKDGFSGSYYRDKKDGWHYTYANGIVVSKAYYSMGILLP